MKRLISILFSLFLIMGCHHNSQLDIQGHRGCRGLLPENSIPAFEKAIELGVTTLEMDVVISKDHFVVVSHEPFFNHEITLDPNGNPIAESEEKSFNLYQMTYDSIKQFDCGLKQHPRFPEQKKMAVYKPLLSDVIAMAEKRTNHKIRYNIEIKSDPTYDGVFTPNVKEFVDLVVAILKKHSIEERTSLQSFDTRAIEKINDADFKGSSVILVDENESIESKLLKLSFKPDIVSPYYELLSKSLVDSLQSEGFKVIPWTVNSEEEMQKMMGFHVDGIITDYPDRLVNMLKD